MTTALNGLRSALFSSARAEPVNLSQGAGLPVSVLAIRYDRQAEPSISAARFRSVQFEIAAAALPTAPQKGDVLSAGADTFRVTQVEEQPGTGSWLLTVER